MSILEKILASLEEAAYATVFSSGISALMAMISTLSSGDQVVALNGIYGVTYRLFTGVVMTQNKQWKEDLIEDLDRALELFP